MARGRTLKSRVLSVPRPDVLVILCALFFAGVGVPGGASGAAVDVGTSGLRVVRADAQRVVVEVTAPAPQVTPTGTGETSWLVEGWSWTLEEGAPELPVTGFDLAVPPGTRPVLSVRAIESLPWPGDAPRPAPARSIVEGTDGLPVQEETRRADPRKYAEPFPTAWASLGRMGRLRFLRVVSVTVSPYRWDPSLRAVMVASKLEVEVRFEADPAAAVGGASAHQVREREPGDDPGWDRLYDRSVLNAESARSWRRASAPRSGGGRGKSFSVAPEFRIPVTQSDVYRVPFASLAAAGWTLPPVRAERIILVERFFDENLLDSPGGVEQAFREQPVPILVRDLDGDGEFGPGDDFLFFGLDAWDRMLPLPRDKRYGREHSYFVSASDEEGARFAEEPSFLDRDDLVPVTSSVVTRRYEGDGVYMPSYAATDETSNLSLGVEGIRNEHFYWVGGNAGDYTVRFDLPGILPGSGNLLRLRIPVQRLATSSASPAAVASFALGAAAGSFVDLAGTLRVPGKERRVYELGEADLATFTLGAAHNTLRMRLPVSEASAALDWMEWTWRRELNAVDGRLFFRTDGSAGPQEFRLRGFSSADTTRGSRLILLDLADSARTAATSGPRLLTWRPSQYRDGALRVQLAPGDPSRPRIIYAVSPAAAIVPSLIEPVSQADPAAPDGPDEDLVVIVHPDLVEGIAPLVQARRAQGLSVRVVTTREVYDRFNGGRPWPTAIRNYLRCLFEARQDPPSFLLLVGDASDDFTGANPMAAPSLVPTQTVFADAFGEQGRELVASDEWFVDDLVGRGERIDFRPDMHVGRIPARTATDLTTVVDKILRYGEFLDTDVWRSRALLISDDEFSSTLGGLETYKYRGDTDNPVRRNAESVFRWAAWETRRIIHEEANFAEFAIDTFFTASYMDTVPGLKRCREEPDRECTFWTCPVDGGPHYCLNQVGAPYGVGSTDPRDDNNKYGPSVLSPILRRYLSRGYLLAIYQGHANAHLMSHEYIYKDHPCLSVGEDTPLIENGGRPFVFLGFACHLGEFSAYNDGDACYPASICENMLFADRGRGAVATLASTAYEWMYNTVPLNLAIARAMFVEPPLDPGTGRTRWLLGEIVTSAKAALSTPRFNAPSLAATYALLGDPSMPMEMAPPRLSVFVNCDPGISPLCEPWQEGTPLDAEAGSDTVRIRVLIKDEQALSGGVTLSIGTAIIDSAAYRLVSDPVDPDDDRRLELTYNRALVPPVKDYEIEVKVVDAAGLARQVVLPVRLGAEFYTVRDSARTLIRPDDVLESGDSVIVSFASPVAVEGGATSFWLDDAPLQLAARLPDDRPRRGELRAILPELAEGTHRLSFRTSGADGVEVQREAFFTGPGGGGTRFLLLYNFPNPFEDGTAFCYRLNRTAISAKVTVFTLSGRKIWSAAGSARANDNAISWDGRDADGDPVANGLYLYKIEVRTAEGRTLSRVERVARIQ